MKILLFAAIILAIPSVAQAEYKCMIESSHGRSQVRTMESFVTLKQAENTVKNYVIEKPQLINRDNSRRTAIAKSQEAYLICFDEAGETVLSKYYRSVPNCEVSKWDGSFECEDFVIE
jgi:hypothetical protein